MKMTELLPFWLLNSSITGRDPEDEGGEGEGGEGDPNDDDPEGGEGEGENSDEDLDVEEGDDPAALKRALSEERKARKEERRLRRKAERDARAAQTKRDKDQEQSELTEAQKALETERTRTKAMATRLLNKERDDAIRAEAVRLNFIDPTDALTDDIRSKVVVDQDDEDPSDIEVDTDSVKVAVRELAQRKKHLIQGKTDGQPSGGRFSRAGGGQTRTSTEEDKVRSIYPGL